MGSQETLRWCHNLWRHSHAETTRTKDVPKGIQTVQLAGFPHSIFSPAQLSFAQSHHQFSTCSPQFFKCFFQWTISNRNHLILTFQAYFKHQIGDSPPNSHPNLPVTYQRAPHKSRRWTLNWDLGAESFLIHEAIHVYHVYLYLCLYLCQYMCIYIYLYIYTPIYICILK